MVRVDLNRPMSEIRKQLSAYPIKTRLSLTGTLVVARDIAHGKFAERIERGEGLPQYVKDHPIYYAGPAKTPAGYASGSFGPTTAGRMDSYVGLLMEHGGGFISLAKGNRSKAVTDACKKYGGFYLGSIGGPAAILAKAYNLPADVAASAMDNILKMNPTWWNRGELQQPLMEAMAEALGSVGALQLPIDWKAATNDSFVPPSAKTQ